MDELFAVDPYLKNAYSQNVSFDMGYKNGDATGAPDVVTPEEDYNPEISLRKTPSKEWELDVRALISSRKWLQNYGLKRNKLTLHQLLPVLGFKLSDDFDFNIKRPVGSRYGEGLFSQLLRPDGRTFNITCSRDKLKQIGSRLCQAITLYKRRLEWLTTESRRLFGIIEEKAVTIVLDIRNMSPQQYDQYKTALERVIYEQLTQVAKFNLIRAADDMQMYQEECVPVTHDTIEGAIKWLWDLDRLAPISKSAAVEAVMKAIADRHNEAVYLFTEGTSVEGCREILKEKIVATERKIPVHVVSYNCDSSHTIRFLREFASITGAKFHAYAVIMEMDAYEGLPVDPRTNRANIVLKKKTYGGVPAGAGMREDVVLIFEELEEARNTLAQVQEIMEVVPEPKLVLESKVEKLDDREKSEQYMSSKEWLKKHGIDAKKLDLYDVLGGVAFKHQDGIVDVREQPPEDTTTSALSRRKLINARYCDRFPVVKWKDGQVVHVQVTPELHRNYEQRMQVALNQLQQRIDWLNHGSRALFGTVIEDQIYILIDTSSSMVPSIQFVKDKLFILMQEQLRHKMKFNLVAYNSKATAWQNRLVEVNEHSLKSAWKWVQGLTCWGSTNTYSALQHALSDPGTQAIYLLTDGRPDQPPKSIIAQVQMQHNVPVHTISFNCNDTEANQFLFDLSQATGGRYHYFSEKGVDGQQPESWESEDIQLLKEDIKRGLENMDKVAELRDECANLSWRKEVDALRKCSRDHPLPDSDRVSSVPAMDPRELYRTSISPTPPPRPKSAPLRTPRYTPSPPPRPSTALGFHSGSVSTVSETPRPLTARPGSARGSRKPKAYVAARQYTSKSKSKLKPRRAKSAGHTRTSLLRTLNSSGRFSPNEWLLPETRQLFEKQADRQKHLAEVDDKRERARRFRKKKLAKSCETSSKQWLIRNGLVAKKLTILDALAPTFVPHKAKYVPILDKHVLSRVFDEILPIAHVSGRSRKQIKLVNPNGVNLVAYEEKLEKAIELYKRRLDTLVWEALPEKVQEELEGPLSFADNKLKLMKALDEAGWPIREGDIILLEDEIARGEKFLQQSQDLRQAADPKNQDEDEDLNVFEDRNSVVSSLTARSNQEFEGLGRVIQRKAAKKLQSDPPPKPPDPPTTQVRVRKVLDTLKGQKVIARREEDGLYYPGTVIKCTDARHALIDFLNKPRVKIPNRLILPTGGAIARPFLRIGDYVLVRVVNMESDSECYVPGIIQIPPRVQEKQTKFFTVIMYNGQTATTMRNHLIKISKARFEFAISYIAEVQNEDKEKVKRNVYISPRKPTDKTKKETESPERTRERRRSHSRSSSSSRSRSRSRSSSKSRSRSRSSSRSRSPKQRKSRSHSSSRSNSPEQRKSRSKSRSRSRSKSPIEVVVSAKPTDEIMDEKEKRLEDLQKQMAKQQKHQEKQQKKLKKQAKKLKDMKKKLRQQPTLLKNIVNSTPSPGRQSLQSVGMEYLEEKPSEVKGRRVVRDEQPTTKDTPYLLQLRRSLPPLREGEEVLARWSDEGWYYRGIVHQDWGDFSYFIEDSTGDCERIWREDIITDNDDANYVLQPKDPVVGLHPSYSFSYAPGAVVEVYHDLWMKVRFYDGEEAKLPREEVYKLTQEKFEHDVTYIINCEKRWVGQAIVARDEKTGIFHLGSVKDRVGNGRRYTIEWCDKSTTEQDSIHIFGVFTKRHDLAIGDHVLGVSNAITLHYLPGTVVGKQEEDGHISIEFCDGSKSDNADPLQIFWLSQDYYENAVQFYQKSISNERHDQEGDNLSAYSDNLAPDYHVNSVIILNQ